MKIQQQQTFTPITITLETRAEAVAFISIIDKAEHNRTSLPPQEYTRDEVLLAIDISNAFTDGEAIL